ncbi:ADP-ribosylation factor-like protein 6-interacting protein 1 [Styela clava]|uniref:ADP-ribosylation factor-like protein 6-interacting protein 1 n=1 Tax=Styela clava TaxID=7725 RepID=UPI001939DDF8|nr:ADP-ribosylation factor-like protein 6-interacting protein 1 [Styela clava]
MENPVESGDFLPPIMQGSSSGGTLKGSLKGWREVIVVLAKLLKWQQAYYAAIVFAIVSLFFSLIWWLDPSVVTGFSMLIMIACIADYVVPLAMPMIFPETSWSSDKEKQYVQACDGLVQSKKIISSLFSNAGKLKDKNPWLYMAAITVSLSTLAWLGNQMHNLLLAYFFVLIVSALPGLSEHGILDKIATHVKKVINKQKSQ